MKYTTKILAGTIALLMIGTGGAFMVNNIDKGQDENPVSLYMNNKSTKILINEIKTEANTLKKYEVMHSTVPVEHEVTYERDNKIEDIKDGKFPGKERITIKKNVICSYRYCVNLGELDIKEKSNGKLIVTAPRAYLDEDSVKYEYSEDKIDTETESNLVSKFSLEDSDVEADEFWQETCIDSATEKIKDIMKSEDEKARLDTVTKQSISLFLNTFGVEEGTYEIVINNK